MPLPRKTTLKSPPKTTETEVERPVEEENVEEESFSLSPLLESKEKEEEQEQIPETIEEDKEEEFGDAPEEMLSWLMGSKKAAPTMVSEMMSDVSNKMAMYLAYTIVKRLSRLDKVFTYINKIEDRLFDPKRDLSKVPEVELRKDYTDLSKMAESFMEYARKFAIQNRDLVSDPERDEVASMLRSMQPEAVKRVKEVIQQLLKRGGGSVENGKTTEGRENNKNI